MVNARLLLALLVAAPGLAAAAPEAAPAGPRVKVAIVPGVAVNLDSGRVDALAQDLAEALSAQLEVDAVGGLDVRRELPTDGLPPDCVTKPACTADVAKRTGASQLLFIVMVGSGTTVTVDTTWVQPSTGQSAARPAIDLSSTTDDDAKAKFSTAAAQLLPDAPIRPKPTAGTVLHVGIHGQASASTPRHFSPPSLATAGLAVVGLGVGIGFGLEARSSYHACQLDCTTKDYESRTGTIRTDAAVADIGFAVATGAAIATAVLWATSGESPHVVVAPMTGGVALTAMGRF